MNLGDLRKLTVKKHLRIRFPLSNGMECMINEHGIAQVPALRAVPSFNLEDELVHVQAFQMESADGGEKGKGKPAARRCTRDELAAMTTAGAAGETAHDDHED